MAQNSTQDCLGAEAPMQTAVSSFDSSVPPPASTEKRLAWDGQAYTYAEFQEYYGESPETLKQWKDAPLAEQPETERPCVLQEYEHQSASSEAPSLAIVESVCNNPAPLGGGDPPWPLLKDELRKQGAK